MEEKMMFTKDTTLGEVLKKHPKAQEILAGFGLHCFGCPCTQRETIEQACEVHGLDLELMLEKLNA